MSAKMLKSPMGWDEFFFRHVYLAASKSIDPRTKIGAVLVKDKIIISEGYNGFPRGVLDLEERYLDRTQKTLYVSHSESNSVTNACRHGISTLGSTCYTQVYPCCNCAKILIQAGITEVVYHDSNFKMHSSWDREMEISRLMMIEAGVLLRGFKKNLGIRAFCNGKSVLV